MKHLSVLDADERRRQVEKRAPFVRSGVWGLGSGIRYHSELEAFRVSGAARRLGGAFARVHVAQVRESEDGLFHSAVWSMPARL